MSTETDEDHQKQAAAHAERMAKVRAAEQLATQATARAELCADLTALRAQGVKTFKGSGIDVEFFPVEAPAEKATKQPDVEMCACGHHKNIAHDGADMCVEGCTPEQCNPKAGK